MCDVVWALQASTLHLVDAVWICLVTVVLFFYPYNFCELLYQRTNPASVAQ